MSMSGSEEKGLSILKQAGVLEFIQYAAAYCALVEPQTTPQWDRSSLIECRRLLAWVYATGITLPELAIDPFVDLERVVTESEYELVKNRLEQYFGENDLFLNAQMEDMKYSDIPISVSTSEILADIYQCLADTIWIFRGQLERNMRQAIAEVRYAMEHEWGTLLLAALRQLHDLHVDPNFEVSEDELDEQWDQMM